MRMEFFGCGNRSRKHWVSVDNAFLTKDGYRPKAGDIEWQNGVEAIGFVEGIRLNGNYRVHFKFEATELKNWLIALAKNDPMMFTKLIADVQATVVAGPNS